MATYEVEIYVSGWVEADEDPETVVEEFTAEDDESALAEARRLGNHKGGNVQSLYEVSRRRVDIK